MEAFSSEFSAKRHSGSVIVTVAQTLESTMAVNKCSFFAFTENPSFKMITIFKAIKKKMIELYLSKFCASNTTSIASNI